MDIKKCILTILFSIIIIAIFPQFCYANNNETKTKDDGIYKIAIGKNSNIVIECSNDNEKIYMNNYRR